MNPNFVHLHCHTEYSLLDGAIRLEDLCKKAKDFGMPAVAITDHGNLHGAIHFYTTAKKYGLKPIIGCEVYVCADHTDRSSENAKKRYHLVLLAQNKIGYHNLCKLVSVGALEGFYVRPRVDKALLQQYSEGIIALSACLAGEIPKLAKLYGYEAALQAAKEYAEIYPDRFYLEIQSNGLAEQEEANKTLIAISKETGIPLVATNDCHYLNKDDVEAHDILLCIQTQAKASDEKRFRFTTQELYYKSPEEMARDFSEFPEALDNAAKIGTELCEDYEFDFNQYHFPIYELPQGVTLEDEFRRLSREGLENRFLQIQYPIDKDAYRARLEHELDVICDMQFPGYFLIVQDFINWAKNNGIPVGPGRGSAAGSLVAYALRITNLDPIPYNLLFERFLNSERISMPDIDVDFCEEKRGLVIEYVNKKYGAHSVAQITTFGKMMAKGVVRDVGRTLGMTFQETDRIAKLIPNDLKMTIQKALDIEPDLLELYRIDPQIKKLLDISMRLEGLSRHASIHAAGLVISDRPMVDYLPLYRGKRESDVVTQYDMKIVEKIGLIKFDFLGLRNMTIINDTLKNIEAQGKKVPDLESLPLDDSETYKLYASGETDGIFQVESSGMRQYLRMLRPTVFEDIIAMLALYRPGPLKSGMVLEFIKRKHGQVEINYIRDNLDKCLQDTYGVIVYQEQVMQIAQIVGGYTLGEADLLRRAMGKKDPAAMAKERSKFVDGAAAQNVPSKEANEIFDLMEKFAEYGFNKSHSAAYALISYQTAYLKTHYTKEFMAALLSSEMGNQDKILKYVAACKDVNVPIEAPNIQRGYWHFSVAEDSILFGLGAIKNVGEEAIKEIVQERTQNGPFTSLYDLCCRVSLRKVSKRVLESLIKAGACDCFKVSRAGLLSALETVMLRAQKHTKEKETNQLSLFSAIPELAIAPRPGIGFDCPEQEMSEWPSNQVSRHEKEALGFFLNNHPLIPYRKEIQRLNLTPLEECRELPAEAEFKTAVLVTSCRYLINKKNQRWALLQVEDLSASGTAFCFHKVYTQCAEELSSDLPLYIEGKILPDRDEEQLEQLDGDSPPKEIKFSCEKVLPLHEACANNKSPLCIPLYAEQLSVQKLEENIVQLKRVLEKHKGSVPVHIKLFFQNSWCLLELAEEYTVHTGPDLDIDLKSLYLDSNNESETHTVH